MIQIGELQARARQVAALQHGTGMRLAQSAVDFRAIHTASGVAIQESAAP